MANERLDRFTKLLKEIFELDKSDLNFGIYRVMNLRKTQIEEFLTQRLPQMVQVTLTPFVQGSKEEIRAQMTQIEENVAAMGMTVDTLPDTAPMKQKYIQLQKQLTEGTDLAALETDVYSALYSFFNRYYDDGDFISKRRYKEGVYAIPYEGEEVKLYWANQDQYYIKTSENFRDYTFVFDGISVHFRLVDATTEQNNNKESKDSKRTFMLFTEDEENYPGIKTFEYNAEVAEIVIRLIVTRICLYTKSPPKGGLFHVLGQKKEDKRMDLNSLAPLMVKHGAVIRAIPESIREVFEKRHINDYPNGEVKYLPEYKREMIVTYKHPTLGGKFALTFAKHTNNDVAFAKWLFFDSLEEVAGYLAELEEDNQ